MGTMHRPVEEILQELVRKKGIGYLRDGKFFVNAVREMGGEEEGCTLLEYLVAVNGHMDLLNAMEQSPAAQKATYTRTVQKLHSKKLIPEELAHKACASFWRGTSRQEPPVKWEEPRQEIPVKREAPRSVPVPQVPASARQQTTAQELYDKAQACAGDGNWAEAVGYYRRAAEMGLAPAQYNLGFCYDFGKGTAVDHSQAVYWYRKAAEQGYAKAQFNLGCSYRDGEGTAVDRSQSFYWYRKAAEQGHASAQNCLAVCYYEGRGTAVDYSQAFYWDRKAAEQGLAQAQYNLGIYYQAGKGTAVDHSQAVYWYRKAAEQGHSNAQVELSLMYESGKGVGKDLDMAIYWYRKAMETDPTRASSRLRDLEQKKILWEKEKKIQPVWLRIKKVLRVLKILFGAAGVLAGLSDLMEEFSLTNLFYPAMCGGLTYSSITGKWRTEKMSSVLMDIFMIFIGLVMLLAGLILLKEVGAFAMCFIFMGCGLELLEMAGDDFVKRAIGQGR